MSPACRGPMVAKPPVEHRASASRTMPRARGNDDTRHIETPRPETPRIDERRSHTPRIEAPRTDERRSHRPRTETPRTDERRSHTPRIEAPRDKTPRSSMLNCGASMRLQTQVSATTPVQGDHPSADEA